MRPRRYLTGEKTMPATTPDSRVLRDPTEAIELDLKDPLLAAFLAWLIPGLGHWYQGRTGKGVLFMVCILGTYFFGLYLGQGHVVYASMRQGDRRLPYLCQIGVGLPALPAVVQAQRLRSGKHVLWDGFMAPPRLGGPVSAKDMSGKVIPHPSELAKWHYELHNFFELGTVYTMIAGLLNVLAIYDAWAGPVLMVAARKEPEE
ncbi:MAG: hypothetical protein A2W31_04395 [Planctomycetes bacterium RBG_16_64_10]|nr:MAG: hypothetical protein A2W31_04395 [Planctomycetes bacterium RBG_16_64_10]